MARARIRLVRWDARRFIAAVDGAFAQRMNMAAMYLAAEVKRSMKGGGRPHVPSRPGQPPHIDTGELRRSIHHQVIIENHVVRGFVHADAVYARALELGYLPGNLLPRPFLRPALARCQPAIIRILIGKPITGAYTSLADIRTAQGMGLVPRTSFGGA